MKNALSIVLILAVAVVGLSFLQQEGGDEGTGNGATPATDDPPPAKKNEKTGLEPAKAKGPLPAPIPEELALKTPARLLLLGRTGETWNRTMLMVCGTMGDLSYASWYTNGAGAAGPKRGMTALSAKPTAEYLDSEDVTVLVLDTIDPNGMPSDFWTAVAQRVNSGRMGLFVRPSFPTGNDGKATTEHPLLSHPVVRSLLPIKKAALLSGTPIPGVFKQPQKLAPTAAGHRHPATRLIAVPEVSVKAWAPVLMGEGAFATKFCYPVEDLVDGAQTLMTCDAAVSLPAIVATAPDAQARVLWMGNTDFGHRTHFVTAKDKVQKLLVNHALVWLAGQAN